MKKIFTLVAMATMALAANAQHQDGRIDVNKWDWTETDGKFECNMLTGEEFGKTANVTWTPQMDFYYTKQAITAEADLYNTVTIDRTAYTMTTGIQAIDGNGKDPNKTHTAPASRQGSEQFFECTGTGYLYVFSKTSNTKKYYVYEGDIINEAGQTFAYTHWMADQASGKIYSYTLPADEQGYVAWPAADATYPIGHFLDKTHVHQPNMMPGCENLGGNSLGVIAFPVYGTPEAPLTYCVLAAGSKLTTNGFVFVPNEKPTLANIPVPTYSKTAISTGIQNVENVENAKKAPVKVVKNGQIMIGDFNIAGQRVK